MLIHFGESSYFKNIKRVDQHLVEDTLLPGLVNQGRIAGGSKGILLPGDLSNPEYISLDEAAELVIDYLEENKNLYSNEKASLVATLNKIKTRRSSFTKVVNSLFTDEETETGYEEFGKLAKDAYDARIKAPGNILNPDLLGKLATTPASSSPTPATATNNPLQAIKDYNELYTKLLRYSQMGVPDQILNYLVPPGVSGLGRDYSKRVLASIILHNLNALHSAASGENDPELQNIAISHTLEKIILTSNPEQAGFITFLSNEESLDHLKNFITHTSNAYTTRGNTLADLERSKIAAATSLDDIAFNNFELQSALYNNLPFTNDSHRREFALQIIKEINRNYKTPLSATEIIALAAKQYSSLNIDADQITHILDQANLTYQIEYSSGKIHYLVNSHELTRSEINNLLKNGLNPFLLESTKAGLAKEESGLLSEYNATSGQSFTSTQEAFNHFREHGDKSIAWTRRFRTQLDKNYSRFSMTEKERKILSRTEWGRSITRIRDRLSHTERALFDKWFNLEQNLYGKRIDKIIKSWDSFAEKFVLPGTKIPLFRFYPWLYEQIDFLKKRVTSNLLVSARNKWIPAFEWLRRPWKSTLQFYRMGDYSVDGATVHAFRLTLGSGLKWAAGKSAAYAAKTGGGNVLKYAAVSGTRTAIRFLAKVGGKALAKMGAKAIATIAAAGSVIATGVAIIATISLVLDLLKLAWDLVRQYLKDADFRGKINRAAAAILIFVNIKKWSGFFSIFAAAFAPMIATMVTAIFVSLGLVFFVGLYSNFEKTTFQLDDGPGEFLSNVICSLAGSTPEPNSPPTVSAAKCIYDFLQEAGINPLTASNAQGSAWTKFATALGNSSAATIIKESAIGQGVFQCVGYIAGVGAMAGKPFNPTNACLYVNNPPSGYSWTTKPTLGCFFVVGSDTCSQCGLKNAPKGSCGHVGVVTGVKGAIIEAADANGSIPWGTVRIGAQFPTSSIAGYMCP